MCYTNTFHFIMSLLLFFFFYKLVLWPPYIVRWWLEFLGNKLFFNKGMSIVFLDIMLFRGYWATWQHNYSMYWKSKTFLWLALLWYSLCCGCLELNFQYLWDVLAHLSILWFLTYFFFKVCFLKTVYGYPVYQILTIYLECYS